MLKPEGKFLILFMAWLPFESEIARKSETLVLKYNPLWTGCNFVWHKPDMPDWSNDYFNCVECLGYKLNIPFTRESWHGRIVACRGIGASSLPQSKIKAFKKEHWQYIQTIPKQFVIPHYVTMLDFKQKACS